jgi:hypothetical protein
MERIDLFIDYLDRQLFSDATFEDLIERGRRPYLILNAADMVEGAPFSFTQFNMDLLFPRPTVDWDTSQADDFRERGGSWTRTRT